MVMNAQEVESVLCTKMENDQIECPLCEQKLIMKTFGAYHFLCCPNYDHDICRCKVKLGVSLCTGPCRGCFPDNHKIVAGELAWFWEFIPFNL